MSRVWFMGNVIERNEEDKRGHGMILAMGIKENKYVRRKRKQGKECPLKHQRDNLHVEPGDISENLNEWRLQH